MTDKPRARVYQTRNSSHPRHCEIKIIGLGLELGSTDAYCPDSRQILQKFPTQKSSVEKLRQISRKIVMHAKVLDCVR